MLADSPLVLVVDDDPSICSSIKRLLKSVGLAVRTFSSPQELFAHGRPEGPCCLLLDFRLPGCDGISVHEQLVLAGICVPTIFISGHGDIPTSVRAMKSGAIDFLTKPYKPQQLIASVLAALESDRQSQRGRQREQLVRHRFATLTPREREIFASVASGMLNKQVAYECDISEKTVKVHRARVMEKMGAEALADLVRMADLLELPCERHEEMSSGV